MKARPTTYKGIEMRSRLEASVAQALDAARIRWEYEPRAYADESGQYLPDFQVYVAPWPVFVEVKPTAGHVGPALQAMQPVRSSEPADLVVIRPPDEAWHEPWYRVSIDRLSRPMGDGIVGWDFASSHWFGSRYEVNPIGGWHGIFREDNSTARREVDGERHPVPDRISGLVVCGSTGEFEEWWNVPVDTPHPPLPAEVIASFEAVEGFQGHVFVVPEADFADQRLVSLSLRRGTVGDHLTSQPFWFDADPLARLGLLKVPTRY